MYSNNSDSVGGKLKKLLVAALLGFVAFSVFPAEEKAPSPPQEVRVTLQEMVFFHRVTAYHLGCLQSATVGTFHELGGVNEEIIQDLSKRCFVAGVKNLAEETRKTELSPYVKGELVKEIQNNEQEVMAWADDKMKKMFEQIDKKGEIHS